MIYGRFGQQLTIVRRAVQGDADKFLRMRYLSDSEIQVAIDRNELFVVEDTAKDLQLYAAGDLNATGGAAEIKAAIESAERQSARKLRAASRKSLPPSAKSKPASAPLLDGRWEPYDYIADLQQSIRHIDEQIRDLQILRTKAEGNIARAKAFVEEHHLHVPSTVRRSP